MKNYIIIILLLFIAVLLFISMIFKDQQIKLANQILDRPNPKNAKDLIEQINKSNIKSTILHLICLLGIIFVVAILLIF